MSYELEGDIEKANNGEVPSPFGKAEYVVHGTPASVQSTKAVREAYLTAIKKLLKNTKYLLTGEIILNVTWLLPTKSRFETDAKADIDNCLKPIIDAFTGPDGLLIDDCQLRGLYICWRHINSDDERLVFEFEFQADQYTSKDHLAFVRLDGALCIPVNLNWPKAAIKLWARMLEANQAQKYVLEKLGVPYPAVAGFIGGSQPFHRTRVNGFKVLSLTEFESSA
ncbi:RusA family crossover junction endodeoxyribonuclease [Salinicola halophyticus]|uniref:RusA family crossover junction endodeoxyribonuclease n=1 Tax=Salinicola halophyticus TaxID=1808881 RepID=UPI003F4581FD